MKPVQVARCLRVSTKSAYQWRRPGGRAAWPRWRPRGRAGRTWARQRTAGGGSAVDAGPAHGADWPTVPCPVTLHGTSYLQRVGFSPQMPAHRAAERNEAARTSPPRGARTRGRQTSHPWSREADHMPPQHRGYVPGEYVTLPVPHWRRQRPRRRVRRPQPVEDSKAPSVAPGRTGLHRRAQPGPDLAGNGADGGSGGRSAHDGIPGGGTRFVCSAD